MAVSRVLDIERCHTKHMANPPHNEHDVTDIDSERTIHGTAFTYIALRGRDLRGPLDELRGHVPFLFQNFPHGLFNLAHWRKTWVFVVGKIIVTSIGAKSTVHTGIHVNFKTGTGLAFQDAVDDHLYSVWA